MTKEQRANRCYSFILRSRITNYITTDNFTEKNLLGVVANEFEEVAGSTLKGVTKVKEMLKNFSELMKERFQTTNLLREKRRLNSPFKELEIP